MDAGFFLKGLAIGFSIAAPVGPIGLLTIRRTLASGWLAGFVTGMGAASADALYGAVAAFGLSAVSNLLAAQQGWLRLVGGMFLLYLGARIFSSQPPGTAEGSKIGHFGTAWFSSFLLTLTNPATILSFIAVFAGMGLAASGAPADAVLMVAGVFLGSAVWWLILSGVTARLRVRLAPGRLVWINRGSGILLIVFGGIALFGAA